MKSFLLVSLTCLQVLLIAQEPINQGADFDRRIAYREYYQQPGVYPKTDYSRVLLKTCAAVGVAALTFTAVAAVGIASFDCDAPQMAIGAAAVTGGLTFCYFTLGEK